MIRKDKRPFSNGTTKTWVRVVEGYRPALGLPPKQRTIKSFGYLEDQDDPEKFLETAREFDENRKNTPLEIEVSFSARMYSADNRSYNYGYKYLEAVYRRLGIDEYIEKYERESGFRGDYSLKDIFRFLVLYRIMSPDSKRATCQMKNELYGFSTEFTLKNIYRALDHYAKLSEGLQRQMNERIKSLIGRDMSFAFYDVTNYYFEIDYADNEGGLRKRGVSKEHRVDPIVQMGLFMDGNGVPVCMSLFPGNTSDSVTLRPAMKKIKDSYGLGRLIVVADKGLNSSKNIDEICNNGDGYVVSQILRGAKGQRYRERLFDESGYEQNRDGSYKYKLFTETYTGYDIQGKQETRERKVLIYWSRADAEMAEHKREEKLKQADSATRNNAYSIKKGYMEYTKEEIIDATTGEALRDVKKELRVDDEKAENDRLYDGYFCIITSEMAYDERRIREVYGRLWRIEESFRIMKSDLDARPVYLNTKAHIEAHFLICFAALLLVRLLQYSMGEKALSVERIARALNAANCQILRGNVIHLDDVGGSLAFQKATDRTGKEVDRLSFSGGDEIADDYRKIQQTFSSDFYPAWSRREEFDRFLASIL